MAKHWEGRIKEALVNRGFSSGEADIAVGHLRGTGGDVGQTIIRTIKSNLKSTEKIDQITETIIQNTKHIIDPRPRNALKKQIGTYKAEISELKSINDTLQKLDPKYVHIPMQMWFNKIIQEMGLENASQVININFKQRMFKGRHFHKRKTLDINNIMDWLKEVVHPETGEPIFTSKDFDFRMVVGAYSEKVGHSRALGKIFKNAYDEGLIIPAKKKIPPDGFGYPPVEVTQVYPELLGKYVDHTFMDTVMYSKGWSKKRRGRDYLQQYDESMNLGRFFGLTKMLAFDQPHFLAMYNLWQKSWSTGIHKALTSHTKSGIQSYLTRDKHYYNALENGAFSTPYTVKHKSFMKDIEGMTETKQVQKVLKRVFKDYPKGGVAPPLLNDYYKLVWNMAWQGDGMVRMGTYKHGISKGMSPQQSAQWTAYMHGDYARLAPGARAILNKVFFTPSFTYTMAHTHANMAKSTVKVMKNALKMKKSSTRDKMLAMGALNLFAGSTALDQFMTKSLGYDREVPGLKYVKRVDTDEGPKELVQYIANPNNTILRKVYQWTNWGVEPNHIDEIVNKTKWQLHPVWRTAIQLSSNQDSAGEPVYNALDDHRDQARDIFNFSINSIVAAKSSLESLIADEPDKAYEYLKTDMGKLQAFFFKELAFQYLRNPKEQKVAYRIKKWQQLYNDTFKDQKPKDEKREQFRLWNFLDKMEELAEEIEGIKF
jgi:hypothetical protein